MQPLLHVGGLKEALFIGAHCDDVEIGCGGTLSALARGVPGVRIKVVLFSGKGGRASESVAALSRLAGASARLEVEVLDFQDGFFPAEWSQIKRQIEVVKRGSDPELVFTHFGGDKHQDHRVLSELTWNTFRNHTIFEYEIPKFDGDLGTPHMYVPLPADIVALKVGTLLECFPSQLQRAWFSEDLFRGLMRVRGMECNSPSGYAEAFHARKWVADWAVPNHQVHSKEV